jgi:hypothetical protein
LKQAEDHHINEQLLVQEKLAQADEDRNNNQLLKAKLAQAEKGRIDDQRLLREKLAKADEDRNNDQLLLKAKLAQADEDRNNDQVLLKAKLAQVDEILEARLKDQLEARLKEQKEQAEQFAPKVEGIPVVEYESLQMRFKDAEQARDIANSQVERLMGRLRELEERLREFEEKPTAAAHERPVQRSQSGSGVSLEEFEALQKQLAQIELERAQFMELIDNAQQAAAGGVSVEEYEALQGKLEDLEALAAKTPQPSVPLEDYEELLAKMELLERQRDEALNANVELLRSPPPTVASPAKTSPREQQLSLALDSAEREMMLAKRERDELSVEVIHLRAQQQGYTEIERAAAQSIKQREMAMEHEMQAMQQELATVLKHLDEVKSENKLLAMPPPSAPPSEPELPKSGPVSRHRSAPDARSEMMNKAASEEVIRREGEKTMMGAKVSELRLQMKKKEAAHKEDITKLNRELMLLRSMSNQEKNVRTDMEMKVGALEGELESCKEQLLAEQMRLEELTSGDQDVQIELAKLQGELEVLRVREMNWQSLAQSGEGGPRESPEKAAVMQGSSNNLAPIPTCDSYIMRLFHRLLWEKFSHYEPEDIVKALKLETRTGNIPKADVEKVLKAYKTHQKNFTIAKAFRNIDVHRTGRLAAHEFELRLTQILSLDVELSGYIYRLLHNCLHPPGDSASSSVIVKTLEDKEEASSSKSGRSTPQRSTTPTTHQRLDSSKSIEEKMITEAQFAHILESRRYTL